MIDAKVIEDSIANGVRLTTLQLRYPRFIHAEFMTHRVFSRNAASSRAIPVHKMIEQVRNEPAQPLHWGENQPGMQAQKELIGEKLNRVKHLWLDGAQFAANVAEHMALIGVHKQVANRVLEPYQFMHTIVTATEWENFFQLRRHPDAQPEIHALADAIFWEMQSSEPIHRIRNRENQGSWHLPYVLMDERLNYPLETLKKMSAARCARVSYLTHDGQKPSVHKDIELYERLVGSTPIHASPTEHQATPMPTGEQWGKNFRGWRQHREEVEFALRPGQSQAA